MSTLIEKLERESDRLHKLSADFSHDTRLRLINEALGIYRAIKIVKQHSYLISLTERKPTIDGYYLVRYERPWAGNTKTIKKFDVVKFENGRFQILDEHITHWFDLPSEVQP